MVMTEYQTASERESLEIASANTAEHETTRFSVINPHRNLNPLSYVKNRTGGDRNRVTKLIERQPLPSLQHCSEQGQ